MVGLPLSGLILGHVDWRRWNGRAAVGSGARLRTCFTGTRSGRRAAHDRCRADPRTRRCGAQGHVGRVWGTICEMKLQCVIHTTVSFLGRMALPSLAQPLFSLRFKLQVLIEGWWQPRQLRKFVSHRRAIGERDRARPTSRSICLSCSSYSSMRSCICRTALPRTCSDSASRRSIDATSSAEACKVSRRVSRNEKASPLLTDAPARPGEAGAASQRRARGPGVL